VDPAHPVTAPPQAIFDGARHFGLTYEEVWRAFDESLAEVGGDATVDEYLQELTGELARRILHKQRHTAPGSGASNRARASTRQGIPRP
jgi:hypothetical protein